MDKNIENSSVPSENFIFYSFEIASDVVFGLILGVIVNYITNYLSAAFKLNTLAKIFLQFMLICTVLYIMKVESDKLYTTWQGSSNYGIMFIAAFLSTQKNLLLLYEHLYDL